MSLRLHVEMPLASGLELPLPAGAARHVQVRRMQPGEAVTLFDGSGRDWPALITAMGRSEVHVRLGEPCVVDRELPWPVTLAFGMPANERMDALVEKATELGATTLQPLVCERSVLRLSGERADRKREHWQAVAAAACEQCGRSRVPTVAPVRALPQWLAGGAMAGHRVLLAAPREAEAAGALHQWAPGPLTALSGPEGGFSPAEHALALAAGFRPVLLGPRVLRADTAPLALLAAWSLR